VLTGSQLFWEQNISLTSSCGRSAILRVEMRVTMAFDKRLEVVVRADFALNKVPD
jgi:hypothetical protein